MVVTILLCLALSYILEVILGSSLETHNAEIGIDVDLCITIKLTNKQFFLQFLPIVSIIVGLLALVAQQR